MDVTETARRRSETQAPQWTLRLLYSGDDGLMARPAESLERGSLQLGRAAEGGLSLPGDRRASRHHATVTLTKRSAPKSAGGVELTSIQLVDQQSKNGTFVNGQRVSHCELFDGDLLRIGDSFLLLRKETPHDGGDRPIAGVIGSSPAMRALRRDLQQFSQNTSTVLLTGDTGTGKEVCAQALHRLSPRAQHPFVVLDCGAVPRTLIESELFGHEAGTFSSSQRSRPGLFEQAHGGTLFIDEIGELPFEHQPVLLRALEQGVIRRAHGSTPIKIDVRVIAATNRDLPRMIDEQLFRADLYARLGELQLCLPPLAQRREDILELLAHLLSPWAPPGNQGAPRFAPDLVEALLLHPFPFNVREVVKLAGELRVRAAGAELLTLPLIEHRLQRPASLADTDSQDDDDEITPSDGGRRKAPSRETLENILEETGGVISEVARRIGCSRKQVYRHLEAHGLSLKK